ncbi:uncharacterized protein [Hoplias malabaricus]|uniref:uncharacterized protein isoform X2 n=1 Tax=Hoplias malabaricus TaxID=27720 RepID=UPI00346238CC
MFHHFLVHAAFQSSRWLPRDQRMKLPKSIRYCEKPLLNNLIASIVFSFLATGLAVALTLTDPVPKSVRAVYHTFGVLSFANGLCTIILTHSAPQCAKTTPELYLFSLVFSWACGLSTVFFVIRWFLWTSHRMHPNWFRETLF